MQEQLQPGKVILVEAGLQTVHAWRRALVATQATALWQALTTPIVHTCGGVLHEKTGMSP